MKNKVIAAFMAAVLILTAFTAALSVNAQTSSGPSLYIDTVEAEKGENVSLKVYIENNPGVWGMDIRIHYDKSDLTLTSVENGDFYQSSEWTKGNLNSDTYILSYEAAGFEDITTKSGILAVLNFKISENASSDEYEITASHNPGDCINVDFDDINFDITNGKIILSSPKTEPVTTTAPTTVAPTTVAPTTVAPTTVPVTTEPAPTDDSKEKLNLKVTSNLYPESNYTFDFEEGRIITVKFDMETSKLLCDGSWTLNYDSDKLTLDDGNNYMPAVSHPYVNDKLDGCISGVFSDIEGIDFSSNETFIEVKFTAKQAGDAVISLDVKVMNLFENVEYFTFIDIATNSIINTDNANKYLKLTTDVSTDSASGYIPGDVNGDGNVDVKDATAILESVVELSSLSDEQMIVADVNKDGTVDTRDATAIMMFNVELISDFSEV